MAAAAAARPVSRTITSGEELVSTLATKGLKVLEVHSTWSGPCKSVVPACKKIQLEKDDEAALAFLVVAAESLAGAQPHAALEAAAEHAGKSEPLFLLLRNGQLKAKIAGANVGALTAAILEHTPPSAEIDDLEDNPFHIALQGNKAGAASSKEAAGKAASKKKG